MEVTKVKPVRGEPWPVRRERHAACCLNYDENHPVVLVHGGEGSNTKILEDMWILDVDTGKWTEVVSHTSLKSRYNHSITASTLAPGLTEVLMFGGQLEWFGDPVAETTIFRFESTVAGPSIVKWALVDVAENSTRGSVQRLREKSMKITKENVQSVIGEPKDRGQPLRDQVMNLRQQLQVVKQSARDAKRRAAEVTRQEQATQHRLQESQRRLKEAEIRIQELTVENDQLRGELASKSLSAQLVITTATSPTFAMFASTSKPILKATDKLDIRHFKMVKGAAWDARAKWEDLSIQLDLSVGTREAIKKSHPSSVNMCYDEMMVKWLQRSHPPPTWVALLAWMHWDHQ